MNIRQGQVRKAAKSLEKDGLAAVYKEATPPLSIPIIVLRGRSLLRLTDRAGSSKTEAWDNDFFVRITDLTSAGVPLEPKQGAGLEVTEEDGHVRRYEILNPGPNEACARKVENNIWWRMHTKFHKVIS